MIIDYHRKFTKTFSKLPQKIKVKFYERLILFEKNPFDAILNNHSVDHTYSHWRSINITGNYRALYKIQDDEAVLFMKIGTHSELYGK